MKIAKRRGTILARRSPFLLRLLVLVLARYGLCSQILNVNIGAEPDVVGKIPADVVRILIDDYVV